MTQDNTPNTTPDEAAQAPQDSAQVATPQVPEVQELPPILQNTDSLEALMKKAAGQLH